MSPAQRTPILPTLPEFHELLRVAPALLVPVAASLYAVAAWRLAADLGWAGAFFVRSGPLSHWQVWIVCAAGLQIAAKSLGRAAQSRQRS